MLGMFAFFACYNAETEVIEVEKQVVVEKEVIKEVEVPTLGLISNISPVKVLLTLLISVE